MHYYHSLRQVFVTVPLAIHINRLARGHNFAGNRLRASLFSLFFRCYSLKGQLCMGRSRGWTVRAVHGLDVPTRHFSASECW